MVSALQWLASPFDIFICLTINYHWHLFPNSNFTPLTSFLRAGERWGTRSTWMDKRWRTGQSRVLEELFKDSQQVSFSRYFLCLPNKRFNKFCTDGFLVLGHDVDRYSSDDTIPVRQNHDTIQVFRSARTSCTTFNWCASPSARISSSSSSLLLLFFLLLLLLSRHPWSPLSP